MRAQGRGASTANADSWTPRITPATSAIALYIFVVHSFKLPLASVAVVGALVATLASPSGFSVTRSSIPFLAWIVWGAVAGATSNYSWVVTETLVEYSKIAVIYVVVLSATRTTRDLVFVCGWWLLCFMLFPTRGTYFNFLAGIQKFGRYGWNFSFENYNYLAAFSILALGVAGFLSLLPLRPAIRRASFVSAGAIALLIVLTQSRGAFVGLAIATCLFLLNTKRRGRILAATGVIAAGVVAYAPADAWDRFSGLLRMRSAETASSVDSSTEQRIIVLRIAGAILRDHPTFGVGIGAYPEAHRLYAADKSEWRFGGKVGDTHNMYLNLACETGIPGLLLFLGFPLLVLIESGRAESRLRAMDSPYSEALRVLRFAFIAYLIAAIFGTFHRASFFFIFAALLTSATRLLSARHLGRTHPASREASPRSRRGHGAMSAGRSFFSTRRR